LKAVNYHGRQKLVIRDRKLTIQWFNGLISGLIIEKHLILFGRFNLYTGKNDYIEISKNLAIKFRYRSENNFVKSK